ncbi:MAG: hypothetical protein PHW32_04585 [Bacilli bacterium]|nr:hypothetical protein [Bacilli bacterium]MDD4283257.1 hypothetical protein [Bacilli bacterium]MDD4719013.1 hypothetical protein [Bacilli bacterium]
MEILDDHLQYEIDKLIKLGVSIYNLYDNLCRLEKEGQKNSPTFQKYLNYLDIGTEIENQRFKIISQDEEEMNSILYYLEEKYNLYPVDPYYDFVYLNSEAKAATRIMETIETVMDDIEDYEYAYEDDVESYEDFIRSFKVYTTIKKRNIYHNLIMMDKGITESLNSCDEKINQEYVKTLKDLYLDYKYNAAFMDKDIEKSFMINNFTVKDLPILSLKQQAEVLDISVDEYLIEKRYTLAYDVCDKISLYDDFSKFDLLIPANNKRKTLILWYLNNTFNFIDDRQLQEIKDWIVTPNTTINLNEKNKKNILKIINSSLERFNNNEKDETIDGEKTYKKKK